MHVHDPHEKPPAAIRDAYKKYQRMPVADLAADELILDYGRTASDPVQKRLSVAKVLDADHVMAACNAIIGPRLDSVEHPKYLHTKVYEHPDMPGLHIAPSLLSPQTQVRLLSRLLHRDLSEPAHLTNIHTHYKLSYPPDHASFFSSPPSSSSPIAHPLDPTVHQPLSISQLLNKKLRWMTLGGQYDWTSKVYPSSVPPEFPPDIKNLLEALFPATKAEAAIVNLYSPGDTLSVHRDVAESVGTGLISISLGCDAIFVVGLAPDPKSDASSTSSDRIVVMRLRSGDAVYMGGASRFAWHGVPKIVEGTCPSYLADWPARGAGQEDGTDEAYEKWRGWMAGKRVNLNVRQMRG